MENYDPFLLKCDLFRDIEEPFLKEVLNCLQARILTFQKNSAVFSEGDPAENVGLMLSGTCRIVRDDIYGNRSIIATLEPSQLFGEVFACAEVRYLPVSVLAVTDCEIMLIDCRRMLTTCGKACAFHDRLIANLLRIVAQKNLMLNRKIEITSRRSTKEKLMAYLLYEAKAHGAKTFEIPFTRQELADYLGVERSALSAEIGKLGRAGVLCTERKKFTLS